MSSQDGAERSHGAAAVIALYLVLHQLVLCYLATAAWLAPDWQNLPSALEWVIGCFALDKLPAAKLATFQNVVIAACASGLGGGVYMVRQLYLKYAYGEDKKDSAGNPKKDDKGCVIKKFLVATEIPRYILLPFSSVIMGPVLYGLAKVGVLALSGSPTGGATDISRFTILVLCFVLGFAYHDTLGFFSDLSKKILKQDKK